MRVLFSEAVIAFKLFMRDYQAVFWCYAFPLLLLVMFCSLLGHGSPHINSLIFGGLVSITIMVSALFGIGVPTAMAREEGILRRYRLVPVAKWKIIMGTILARYFIIITTILVQTLLARLIYRVRIAGHPFDLFVIYSLGTFTFCAFGYVIASIARTVQAANGMANALFSPMMFLSGATIPIQLLPNWAQWLAKLFPATYLVDAVQRITAGGQGLAQNQTNIAVLLAFGLLAAVASIKLFRWD